MKPVRVLHVLHSMNCGGAETLLMHLYRNMDREQVQFDFLVNVFDDMFYQKEIESLGGHVYRMPFLTKLTPPVYEQKLKAFFKEHDYKIVHSHLETTTGLILRAAKRAGVPVRIAHSHNSRFTKTGLMALPENAFKAYCRTKIVPNATKLYGCSELANAWLYGKHAAEGEQLNNGIDTKSCAFNPQVRAEMRAELGLGDAFTFGHVGRFNDQKNHSFLIEAFKKYHDGHENSRLLLVGEGILMPQIREQAKNAGLEESVSFLGLRSDVTRILQAMDCFLMPSKFEGLPLALVEAQAAALPCLAADTVSTMTDLSAGYFRFIPLDVDKWAEEMASVPTERSAGAEKIVADKGFDSYIQAQKLQSFYLESVANL